MIKFDYIYIYHQIYFQKNHEILLYYTMSSKFIDDDNI